MKNIEELRRTLTRIDGRGYKAYKDLEGTYDFGDFFVYVDHVQGDPFASPSRIRARVSLPHTGIPKDLFQNPVRRFALEDFLTRRVSRAMQGFQTRRVGTGNSGLMHIDAGQQEVLERTACKVEKEWLEIRIYMGLPAAGRRVLARVAEEMFLVRLPKIVDQGLFWKNLPGEAGEWFVKCVENQEHIRRRLDDLGLVAFVADGSILPRESGNTQRPLSRNKAVPFQSPESMRVRMDLPNTVSGLPDSDKAITGLGIPQGVTLIVGGGYHGKSTLLQALERGVYCHIPEDGREYVVTCKDAVKIRAEDGRRIEQVDISPFISNLPGGENTRGFCTDNASGSTSQAANIVEAIEIGARLLLIDEDTSATNFMVRDVRMQELVHKEFEPITPFIDRVQQLHRRLGVSTVLVMGGCGDYFEVADHVVMMREYVPREVTSEARNVASRHATGRHKEGDVCSSWRLARAPDPQSLRPSRGRREVKIEAKGPDQVLFGAQVIDLRAVEQLVDPSQTRAVGLSIHLAAKRFMDGKTALKEVLERLDAFFDSAGLDLLDPFHRAGKHPGSLARPRRYEIGSAINRLRAAKFVQTGAETSL